MQFSLYANLHSQTYGILTVMTFESARVGDFSPHVIFAVEWHRICDLGYMTFWSRWFGLSRFGRGPFWSGPIQSGDILVRLWNLAEILHVHILMQTYLNQREVLFKNATNMIQDPTVNQHQHMIYIIINKQIKSLLTFCN